MSWSAAGQPRKVATVAVKPGLAAAVQLVVGEADTAVSLRSGDVPVLATPRVVGLGEEAAVRAVEGELGESETTVGMQVQLDHLAPTPVGQTVTAEASVEKVNGRRVTFTISVHDDRGLVAVGRVTRVVVDVERFMEKCH